MRALQATHDYFGVFLRGEEGQSMNLTAAIKEATGAKPLAANQTSAVMQMNNAIVSAESVDPCGEHPMAGARDRLWFCVATWC